MSFAPERPELVLIETFDSDEYAGLIHVSAETINYLTDGGYERPEFWLEGPVGRVPVKIDPKDLEP